MRQFLSLAACMAVVCLVISSMAFGQAVVSIDPATQESPDVGGEVTVNINITGGANVAGYQLTVTFDPTALSFVSITNADYLPGSPFVVEPNLDEAGKIKNLAATSLGGIGSGDGTIANVVFSVVEVKDSAIGLEDFLLADPGGTSLPKTTTDGQVTGPVVIVNEPPVAAITASTEATTGETVSFSGAGSTDDSGIASYAWDFGDGSDSGEEETADHIYTEAGVRPVILTVTDNGDPALTATATVTITVTDPVQLDPVITEQSEPFLQLTATILAENAPAKCFIPLWEGTMDAEAGMFLEYQVRFSNTSVHTQGGIYAHAADGTIVGMVEDGAGTDWTHRQVSLDAIAGQMIVAITVGTDNGETPTNAAGEFGVLIDNVQITNGTGILTAVWVDQPDINGADEVAQTLGDTVGVENCLASIPAVAVQPQGKMITTWGRVKDKK